MSYYETNSPVKRKKKSPKQSKGKKRPMNKGGYNPMRPAVRAAYGAKKGGY